MLNTKKIIALLAVFFGILTASAQGKSYVGYCDGLIASSSSGKYTGLGTANGEVNVAIRLPKSVLAAYVGNNIVGVNYGMPTSQGLAKMNVWVRAARDGENLTDGSTTKTGYGWHEVEVKPYTITGNEQELWIGATYSNTSKVFVAASFAGTTVTDGCYVNSGDGWTNYAAKGWGSLSIEAIIEGGNVPTRDLSLLDVASSHRAVQVGNSFTVTGKIKNNASETAVNPVISYSINGTKVGAYTHNGSLAHRESANFSISIPTTGFQQGDAKVELALEWADGGADDAPADNSETLTVALTKDVFTRRMVVEEHTGAWCGWCVRGIVGLKEMKERYGDDFIAIGIHNNDAYAVTAYDNFIGGYMEGYPNSIINRSGSQCDPLYTNLANRYMAMEKEANADISVEAAYSTDNKLKFTAHSRFAYSETNADYRVAFVVLENQLPIKQQNYYSGASSAMGGFESMGSPVDINIDDVARGIFPTTMGEKGSVPASITVGNVYDYTYTATMPNYKNGKNIEVVALLLNGKTGEIVNARKTNQIKGLTYGEPDEGGEVGPVDPTVKLAHTIEPAEGATVDRLDKVVITFNGRYAEEGMNHAGYYNYMAKSYGAEEIPISSRPYLRNAQGEVVKKASRIMWTYNPAYTGLASTVDPFNYSEFELDFDGVPAGHYTLVVPKNFFVYYDEENYLCGTKEFTAEYTVTQGAAPALSYETRFSPAEFSVLKQWDVVTLYSSDDIYNYNHTDLATYYNYFYVETAERPYVILPSGKKQEVKYADYMETTGYTSADVMLQLTFPTSYVEGTYTLVIPDDYIVIGGKKGYFYEGYAAPERRFTFFVGTAPDGIAAPTTAPASRSIYDLWGRSNAASTGIRVETGRKVMR